MRLFHLMLALMVVTIWGCNFVVIKIALNHVPPLTLTALRFFLASIPAIFFLKRPELPLKHIFIFGVTMFGLQSLLLFTGIHLGMPSGIASLLLHVHVFFTILFAVIFLGESAHQTQLLGALISFFGIGVIAAHTDGHIPFWGFVAIITAAMSWGIGNIFAKRFSQAKILNLIIWGNFISFIPIFCLTLVIEGVQPFLHVMHSMHWSLAATILYIAYPTTVFAFIIWSWLLQQYTVATIAPFSLLVPVVGMIASNHFLNEPLVQWKIMAALLILLGLCINVLGPKIMVWYKLRTSTP